MVWLRQVWLYVFINAVMWLFLLQNEQKKHIKHIIWLLLEEHLFSYFTIWFLIQSYNVFLQFLLERNKTKTNNKTCSSVLTSPSDCFIKVITLCMSSCSSVLTPPSDCLIKVITLCMSSELVQYSPRIHNAALCILNKI